MRTFLIGIGLILITLLAAVISLMLVALAILTINLLQVFLQAPL